MDISAENISQGNILLIPISLVKSQHSYVILEKLLCTTRNNYFAFKEFKPRMYPSDILTKY